MYALLFSVLTSGSAAPSATLPPEITHTVTSSLCETVHDVSMPIGLVSRTNDKAFKSMADSTQSFMQHLMAGDAPSAADIQADLPKQQRATNVDNGTGTPLSARLSVNTHDGVMYGPNQTLMASRIDAVAQQIYHNVDVERTYLAGSYKRLPSGQDHKSDALRAQAENTIALQQALANRYEQFATAYLDNQNVAEMIRTAKPSQSGQQRGGIGGATPAPVGKQDTEAFSLALRGLLFGEVAGLQAAGNAASAGGLYGYASPAELGKYGTNGQIVQALRRQEYEFSSSLISAIDACGGHYRLKSP